MSIVVVSKDNEWSKSLVDTLTRKKMNITWIKECSKEILEQLSPTWVFFFHWSEIVKKEIFENYRCVVVHTGKLPRCRGGSPIQNQILEKINLTDVNLLTMESSVDSGKIYYNQQISLQGNLFDIWMLIALSAADLIEKCVKVPIKPRPQPSPCSPRVYRRRKRSPIKIESIESLPEIYDNIRMLDAPGYPTSYIEIGEFKLEFTRAKLNESEIIADVRISKK